jgi:hypothetical protein
MNHAATDMPRATHFPLKAFVLTCLIVSVWVNASETFRYFAFVMPMTREAFAAIPGVAPMNWPVFMVWGAWDTLLVIVTVLLYWLYAAQFGAGYKSAVIAGTVNWIFFFVLFWLGMINLRLTTFEIVAIALPLAWLECVISSAIAYKCFQRFTS